MEQFYQLCDHLGWHREDEERKEARELLRDAMTQQFNAIYGTDVDDIGSWRNLCQVLEIAPIPEELVACRNVSRSNFPVPQSRLSVLLYE